jgi:hypothetical protein
MRPRLTTLAALVALAASGLVVTGCSATLDPVARAASQTSDVSTMRFSMRVGLLLPGAPGAVSLRATGVIDSTAHRLSMTMDLSKLAAVTGSPDLGRLTMIEDGSVMYMSGAELSRVLPGGKSWVRIDLAQAASRLGLDVSGLTGGQTDPRTSLAQLGQAGNVVKIGPQTIRGVPTTRYNVLLDLRKGLDRLDGPTRQTMEQLMARLEAAGGRYVPADAWIDSGGFLRRIRLAIPGYLGTGSSFSLTMDMYGFGDPVSVAIPDTSQVADLTGALPSLGA